MTRVEVADNTLTVQVQGIDRVLAMRRRFAIPLDHVVSVETGKDTTPIGGLRVLTAYVPAVVTKTYRQRSGRRRLDGSASRYAITIRLWNERYNRLVLEVENPRAVENAIVRAVRGYPNGAPAGEVPTLNWNPNASAFGTV